MVDADGMADEQLSFKIPSMPQGSEDPRIPQAVKILNIFVEIMDLTSYMFFFAEKISLSVDGCVYGEYNVIIK